MTESSGRRLEVAGRPVATVHSGDETPATESPRPFLHPLRTLGGVTVTELRPDDHHWHQGLSFTVSNLEVPGEDLPVNLWGGPTFHDGEYRQLPNNGRQRLLATSSAPTASASAASAPVESPAASPASAPADAAVRMSVAWETARGRRFAHEERTLAAVATRGGWVLDWHSRIRNESGGELGFGSPTTAGRERAGYGGLFLRGDPRFLGAEVLLDGDVVTPDAAMGSAARWAALRGVTSTVAIAADLGNPVAPERWFVRTDPVVMLCAAPFFDRVVRLPAASVADWRWRVLVADGAMDAAAIAAALGVTS